MTNNLPSDANSDVPNVQDPPVQSQPTVSPQAVPEGGAVAESFPQSQQVESIAPVSPEVQKPVETLPQTDVQDDKEVSSDEKLQTKSSSTQTFEEKVVDKRSETSSKVTHLETTDSLTADADKEEEDFIEHVEEIHSTK